MSDAFPHLFSPLKVGKYTLANRIMNTGHAAHFQTGDGLPTQRYVDYVRERAKGGGRDYRDRSHRGLLRQRRRIVAGEL